MYLFFSGLFFFINYYTFTYYRTVEYFNRKGPREYTQTQIIMADKYDKRVMCKCKKITRIVENRGVRKIAVQAGVVNVGTWHDFISGLFATQTNMHTHSSSSNPLTRSIIGLQQEDKQRMKTNAGAQVREAQHFRFNFAHRAEQIRSVGPIHFDCI